jgi:glutathione S-transferase
MAAILIGLLGLAGLPKANAASKTAASPAVIYYVKGGRSERIIWLMEELGLPYKLAVREGDMTDTVAATETLPMNMAPALAIDNQVLIETGLITEYVLDRYGKGRLAPAHESPDYWRYRLYMQFADGSAVPRVIPDYASKQAGKKFPSVYGSPDNLQRLLKYVESELKSQDYLAGSAFTAADLMMSYPLRLARETVGFQEYPAIEAYYGRITARPAYKKAMDAAQKG